MRRSLIGSTYASVLPVFKSKSVIFDKNVILKSNQVFGMLSLECCVYT